MHMHEQVRRARHERAGHDAAAAAAPVAPLLALQRSAGNRAVQRLVWDGNTNIAHVPEGYWNQALSFDLKKGELKPDDATPTAKDPKLSEILERHPKLLTGVAHGFNVPYIQSMKPEADPKLEDRGRAATKDTDARLLQQLADVARSHNRIALVDPSEATTTANVGAKTPFVLRPTDYFAQKPDLPKAGTPLKKTHVPNKGKLTYYHYTCVLIALVIDGGMAKAKELA